MKVAKSILDELKGTNHEFRSGKGDHVKIFIDGKMVAVSGGGGDTGRSVKNIVSRIRRAKRGLQTIGSMIQGV